MTQILNPAGLCFLKILVLIAIIMPWLSAQNLMSSRSSKLRILDPDQADPPFPENAPKKSEKNLKLTGCLSSKFTPNSSSKQSKKPDSGLVTENPAQQNCQQQDENHKCLTCFKSFVIDSSGKCVPMSNPHNMNDQEIEEGCGFSRIIGKQGSCVDIPPNCLTYTSCGRCLSCPLSFENHNGKCLPVPLKNVSLTSSGKDFVGCVPLASRRGNKCVTQDSRCREVSSKGFCNACEEGFQLKFMVCVALAQLTFNYEEFNCRVWKDGDCVECLGGMQLNQAKRCGNTKIGYGSKFPIRNTNEQIKTPIISVSKVVKIDGGSFNQPDSSTLKYPVEAMNMPSESKNLEASGTQFVALVP